MDRKKFLTLFTRTLIIVLSGFLGVILFWVFSIQFQSVDESALTRLEELSNYVKRVGHSKKSLEKEFALIEKEFKAIQNSYRSIQALMRPKNSIITHEDVFFQRDVKLKTLRSVGEIQQNKSLILSFYEESQEFRNLYKQYLKRREHYGCILSQDYLESCDYLSLMTMVSNEILVYSILQNDEKKFQQILDECFVILNSAQEYAQNLSDKMMVISFQNNLFLNLFIASSFVPNYKKMIQKFVDQINFEKEDNLGSALKFEAAFMLDNQRNFENEMGFFTRFFYNSKATRVILVDAFESLIKFDKDLSNDYFFPPKSYPFNSSLSKDSLNPIASTLLKLTLTNFTAYSYKYYKVKRTILNYKSMILREMLK